ncbi:MAG: hypothetical protein ABIV39_05025 [Verrucomicrobiota bacterium]
MKRIAALLTLPALLMINGCASTDQVILDSTKRAPTTSVDFFKEGKIPDRKFKEIGELSYLGPREDELRAQKRFIAGAQKMGGNGVIFRIEDAGPKGGFTAFQTTAYVFKGKVIVYQ